MFTPIDPIKRKNFDWWLIVLVTMLSIIGVLMIANATGRPTAEVGSHWLQVVRSANLKQAWLNLLWFALGLGLVAGLVFVDYHALGKIWFVIYGANILLLVMVLIVGTVRGGTQGWFIFGERGFQPSEIAKLALILTLSYQLSRFKGGISSLRQLVPVLIMVAIPMVLIYLQPDLGTMLVYVFVTAVLLLVSGTRMWMLGGLTAIGVAAIIPVWRFLLSNEQKERILTFIDPSLDPWGAGYNVLHSKTAIGSGQITGKGFFNPESLTQLNYVPESSTDFIFSVTGETWGLVGSLFVIALYALLIFRLLWLSRRTFDAFGSYIIVGIAAMMMFHIFENIGMAIGLMPVTGIPLPFISYGGSNMWTNMIAIGLVEGVVMRRRRGIFTTNEEDLV